jgi:ATP-dependent exoDNAse (exonuclease V) beta subunit
MSDNPALQATDPHRDASVHASAGTGKTWLLVTRVLRLLLGGARADSILAVTFTRKAAAEMEQRIMERLHELACADPVKRVDLLQQAGIAPEGTATDRAIIRDRVVRPAAAALHHLPCVLPGPVAALSAGGRRGTGLRGGREDRATGTGRL